MDFSLDMSNEDFIINNTQNSLIGDDLPYIHKSYLNFSKGQSSVNGWFSPSFMNSSFDPNHQRQILSVPNHNYDLLNRNLVSTQSLPIYNSPINQTPSKYPFIGTDSYSKINTFQNSINNINHNNKNYMPYNTPISVESKGINDISHNFGGNTMWGNTLHNKGGNTSGYEPILDNLMDESHPFDPSVPEGIKSAATKMNQVADQKQNEKKGNWDPSEDKTLRKLVKLYGTKNWSLIANMHETRIGKQCRERWHNHLRPDIKKMAWSEKEDQILIEAHKVCGNKWTEIALKLPGKSENTVKNRWNATKRQIHLKKKKQSDKNANPPKNDILKNYIRQVTIKNGPPKANETENTKSDDDDDDCENLFDIEMSSNLDITKQTTSTTSCYVPEPAATFSWDDYFTKVCESMEETQKLMHGWN